MDSATEFLFGRSVDSMSSPLPPPGATKSIADTENAFVDAFKVSLESSASRLFVGRQWPLREVKEDATGVSMKVIHDYLEPIVDEALKAKELHKVEEKDVMESGTLLEHLVNTTEGEQDLKSLENVT